MKLRLAEMLEARGVNSYQLAKGLGVTPASVGAWLNGRMRGDKLTRVYPDMDSLEALCLFLECTPNDLLQLERDSIGSTWRDVGEPRRGRPPKVKADDHGDKSETVSDSAQEQRR